MSKSGRPVKLAELVTGRLSHWFWALVLLTATTTASIGLLVASGWFITVAGIAGLLAIEINYFTPAATIRAAALVRTAGRYAGDLVSHNAILHLLKDLRVKVFSELSSKCVDLNVRMTNSIVTMHRLVIDIDRLNLFPLNFILPWLSSLFILIFIGTWYYCLSPGLLLVLIIPIFLAWLIIPSVGLIRGVQWVKQEINLTEQHKNSLIQSLALLTPLLIWKTWAIQRKKISLSSTRKLALNLKQQNLISLIKMLQAIALGVAVMLVLLKGGELFQQGRLSVPWMLASVLGLMGLAECLLPLASSWSSLGASQFAAQRINTLVEQGMHQKILSSIRPVSIKRLELVHLTGLKAGAISGPRDVSFTLVPADIICIRGHSGVGKSTLLDLIAQELKPVSGRILLNGVDLEQWDLTHSIAYLRQSIDIFNLSLAENLRLGKEEASEEELWGVLEKVGLADWARSREGLATLLGEQGGEISGGQGRRIALARLLLTERPLVLLDEPFAGLDQKSILQLYSQLTEYGLNKIIIIVSHHELAEYGAQEYWLT
ncbi:MAG: ATP-binding cassette domain-containing protein [Neisseriaceae bacterium]